MAAIVAVAAQGGRPAPPPSVRLYVFDGGVLESDPARYQLTKADVTTTQLSVAAYLIVHPKGVLLWDTGAITDSDWKPSGQPVEQRLTLPDGQERRVTITASLLSQLKASGYSPADVTYLALSHHHWDHTATPTCLRGRPGWHELPSATPCLERSRQARRGRRRFPRSRAAAPSSSRPTSTTCSATEPCCSSWLPDTRQGIRCSMSSWRERAVSCSRAISITIRKSGASDASPHLQSARRSSRRARHGRTWNAFLKKTGAQLWIQHDLTAHRALRKAPAFYD